MTSATVIQHQSIMVYVGARRPVAQGGGRTIPASHAIDVGMGVGGTPVYLKCPMRVSVHLCLRDHCLLPGGGLAQGHGLGGGVSQITAQQRGTCHTTAALVTYHTAALCMCHTTTVLGSCHTAPGLIGATPEC